ncbi:MAG: RNA polymerase sigma factor [Kiloniellales bacterium]|nr:RNA polymerase sigma factor [Kiloniellales bacterium]
MAGGRKKSEARGDAEPAWLDVFLANRTALLAFLTRKAGHRHQPNDLLHDLFIRMSNSAAVASIDNPRAYLFRAAANVAIDATRAERTRKAEVPPPPIEDLSTRDPSPDALQTAIDRDRLRRLDEALATLPEETRAMIFLLRVDGLSYDEVAGLFGVSKSTVEKRVAKAIRTCKVYLEGGEV